MPKPWPAVTNIVAQEPMPFRGGRAIDAKDVAKFSRSSSNRI